MKAAIFIEDGVQQVVLTPENDWERNSLRMIENKKKTVETFWGGFYNCNGGWLRQSEPEMIGHRGDLSSEASLIFRLVEAPPAPALNSRGETPQQEQEAYNAFKSSQRWEAAKAIVGDLFERSAVGKAIEDISTERGDDFLPSVIVKILEKYF